MWIARQNEGNQSGYWISPYEMVLTKMEVPEKSLVYDDWEIRNDMILLNKHQVESKFGISLEPLQQIEI